MLFTTLFTACDSIEQTIPTVNDIDINDTISQLGVSIDDFTEFLSNIDMTYDEYIDTLNSNETTLSDLVDNVKTYYNCTYEEYVKATNLIREIDLPDESLYSIFESAYSAFDAYIPVSELNEAGTELINYGIEIAIADTAEDAYAFDIISVCNNDLASYMDILNGEYGCTSIEITNIALFGSYGITKPDDENACLDTLFVYDDETDEILQKITMPVITLHMEDGNDITLALSNELGLIFKAVGSDSYEKMLNLSNLRFQIRTPDDDTGTTE